MNGRLPACIRCMVCLRLGVFSLCESGEYFVLKGGNYIVENVLLLVVCLYQIILYNAKFNFAEDRLYP